MESRSRRRRDRSVQTVLVIVAAAALLAAGFWIAPVFTRERVESWIRGAGAWGPLVIVAVQVAQILAAPIPGVFVPLLAGFLYGPAVGTLITVVGTAIGSAIAYGIGRSAGRPLVARWIGPDALEKTQRLLGGRRWLALVPLFLVPFSPSDALCFAAGIAGVGRREFALAVLIGRAPKDAALALAGAGLLRLGV